MLPGKPLCSHELLHVELDWMDHLIRAKRPAKIPLVMSKEEVRPVRASLKITCFDTKTGYFLCQIEDG
jgi:hypothetical protein